MRLLLLNRALRSLGLTLIGIALPKACDARTDGPRDRACPHCVYLTAFAYQSLDA